MYNMIHSIVSFCWRYLVILPVGTLFFITWYLMFPATALYGLIACEESSSFKYMLKDLYVDMPLNFFKWCVLGW